MGNGLFSKKFIGLVGVCTALVIFVCYLFFDLRIVMVIKRAMGMPKSMLTIMDEVPTQLYFDKILPIAKRNGVSVGCNVEPWHVNNWNAWSKVSLKDCLDAGLEVIPMHVTFEDNNGILRDKAAYERQVVEEKHFFDNAGIKTDVVVMPWRSSNQAFARDVLMKHYQATFVRWWEGLHSWPLKSKSEIKEWITGFDKPMNFEEMKRFVDCIQYDNGWGTLMIRSWRTEMMTLEALVDLEKTIQYAKQQGVEVVSLREGLKRFARD